MDSLSLSRWLFTTGLSCEPLLTILSGFTDPAIPRCVAADITRSFCITMVLYSPCGSISGDPFLVLCWSLAWLLSLERPFADCTRFYVMTMLWECPSSLGSISFFFFTLDDFREAPSTLSCRFSLMVVSFLICRWELKWDSWLCCWPCLSDGGKLLGSSRCRFRNWFFWGILDDSGL